MATSTEQQQIIPLTNSNTDTSLESSLTNLSTFIRHIGFTHHVITRVTIFLLLAVATPLLLMRYSRCYGCDKIEIQTFQLEVVLSRALVAAVSLFFVSRNVGKYGFRKALFLDRCHGHVAELYLDRIRVFYCLLGSWFGVCLLLKVARELTRIIYLQHDPWWRSVIFFIASVSSWSYTTLIFLSGCALFNLVGNLQVIRFENFGKFLEKDLDVSVYIEEHMSLTRDLSKISHRFRMFLLIEFLIVTASQFVTLLQTMENQGIINLINGGDFGVLSIVQLVGIVMCLTAAAKISHRAQSLGSIASKWHAYLTCHSDNASVSGDNAGNPEVSHTLGSLTANYSESALESSDYFTFPANEHMNSSTSSYHKRQAFVTYIKSNTGGFTIFGWLVDRLLINTVFFIELSLVFFILGKTITITTR